MKDVSYYKDKLLKEKELLLKELKDIGVVKNPHNPDDWQGKPDELDIQEADLNEVADRIGSYEGNNAVVQELEPQLKNIEEALERIEKGTYGKCSVCGNEIEEARLEANPSATTCKAHLK